MFSFAAILCGIFGCYFEYILYNHVRIEFELNGILNATKWISNGYKGGKKNEFSEFLLLEIIMINSIRYCVHTHDTNKIEHMENWLMQIKRIKLKLNVEMKVKWGVYAMALAFVSVFELRNA